MPHFFADRAGDRVRITGADARHLARSLRARPGEVIRVVDPAGFLLEVRLESVGDTAVAGVVVSETEHRPEPSAAVTMALAMLPAAALEESLARCTEIGAAGFVLVQAERSVVRAAKPERWAAICREAAMLAGRLRVPGVEGPVAFADAWDAAAEAHLLNPGTERRLSDLSEPRDLTLFIGPEGGWSEREVARAGGRVLGLGPRNLRAQTAAVAALGIALAVRGDL